jgi:hypothetical protein
MAWPYGATHVLGRGTACRRFPPEPFRLVNVTQPQASFVVRVDRRAMHTGRYRVSRVYLSTTLVRVSQVLACCVERDA